jgi:carbon monoxide dehydrogenase subunit G
VRIEGRERLALPLEEAWRRLNDPAVVKRCTHGLETFRQSGPDRFEAVLEVSLPALSGRFTGSVEFLERRPPNALRVRLSGKGAAGFVDGEARVELAPALPGSPGVLGPATTDVHYQADVQVGGQIGRLGQRMIAGVAKEMAGQFFEALAAGVAGEEGAARRGPVRAFLDLVWRLLLRALGLSRRARNG